jgi:hypothetical protein
MKKKLIGIVLVFTMVAIAFAGCTGEDDDDGDGIIVEGNYLLIQIESKYNITGYPNTSAPRISRVDGYYANFFPDLEDRTLYLDHSKELPDGNNFKDLIYIGDRVEGNISELKVILINGTTKLSGDEYETSHDAKSYAEDYYEFPILIQKYTSNGSFALTIELNNNQIIIDNSKVIEQNSRVSYQFEYIDQYSVYSYEDREIKNFTYLIKEEIIITNHGFYAKENIKYMDPREGDSIYIG